MRKVSNMHYNRAWKEVNRFKKKGNLKVGV